MPSISTRWIRRISVLLTVAWCGSTPAASAAPTGPASSASAHFSAAGVNDEDDVLRIYSGDFQSVRLDRGGTAFMMISSTYMEDFARDCTRFLPANKVEITVQACPKTDIAFMRDPKTSRFAPSDPTGYCTCLSEKYRGVMTPAEEALYGSNFKDKFWYGIAQPRSTDPAWARLNPGAVSCMQ